MSPFRVTTFASALALAAMAAAGCGSSSSDCAATRTCSGAQGGSAGNSAGGTGGSAGGGGASGGSAGTDGGAGTGASAGSGGTAGTDAGSGGSSGSGAGGSGGSGGCTQASDCTNPDTAHCTVDCVGNACVVSAADKDGDGHGTKQCAAAPGDDCDDAHKTVYPGAPEICDGLDNDCNGKADLADGLPLSGTNGAFVASSGDAQYPDIAWSPASSVYGVAWIDTRLVRQQVYFARMNQAGAKQGGDTHVAAQATGQDSVHIAWGNNAFGIIWRENANPQQIRFVRVTGGGSIVGSPTTIASGAALYSPVLAYHASASHWVVGWTNNTTLETQELSNTGTPIGTPQTIATTSANMASGIGVIGDQFGLLYTRYGTTDSLRWAELDATLGVVSDSSVTPPNPTAAQTGDYGVLAADSTAFSLAWTLGMNDPGAHGQIEQRKADGSVSCGPSNLGGVLLTTGAARYPGGTLVAGLTSSSSPGPLSIQRRGTGCGAIGGAITLKSSVELGRVAYGSGSGFAVVWDEQNTTTNHYEIWRRTFGPLFCN